MQDDIGSSAQRIKSIMMRVRKNKLTFFGSLGIVTLIAIIAIIVHFATKWSLNDIYYCVVHLCGKMLRYDKIKYNISDFLPTYLSKIIKII